MGRRGQNSNEYSRLAGPQPLLRARHIRKVASGAVVAGVGRPAALPEAMEKKVVATTESLIQAADGEWQVTLAVIKHALKLMCCERTILCALHRHDIEG